MLLPSRAFANGSPLVIRQSFKSPKAPQAFIDFPAELPSTHYVPPTLSWEHPSSLCPSSKRFLFHMDSAQVCLLRGAEQMLGTPLPPPLDHTCGIVIILYCHCLFAIWQYAPWEQIPHMFPFVAHMSDTVPDPYLMLSRYLLGLSWTPPPQLLDSRCFFCCKYSIHVRVRDHRSVSLLSPLFIT